MVTFLIGIGILILGYIFYSKYVEKQFAPDDRKTPAYTSYDGLDYVPLPLHKNLLIHLLNIAGLGPILTNTKKKGGGGFIAAIVNLTWWLLVATIWACCMIFVYLWKFTVLLGKFVVFLGKKLFYLAKKAAARLRRKEIVEE